ncbi:specifically androgen-regulated gene protein [Brachyhypopomus gauderio]|uniref:specifically androgen-regulated gene protein n=1 Tax=Brachyhypopomus gauderio TaxID=698409 RepID=UPI00404221EE
MPKSETWPGDIAIETTREMDRDESRDRMNDEGLQHLSAEEKDCLMFLEETIKSLDKDNSGPSSDGVESFPAPGNVATKMGHLSAFLDQSKGKHVPKHYSDDPGMFGSDEHNQIVNCLVPTPLVLANSNANIPPKPAMAASKEKLPPKPETAHKSENRSHGGIHVPSEVNMVVIPPAVTVKNTTEEVVPEDGLQPKCASSHGPLSNECEVQLRKSTCLGKTPESEKQHSNSGEGPEVQVSLQLRESQSSTYIPPAVAPKPRNTPSHVADRMGASSPNADSSIRYLSTSPGSRGSKKPGKERLEALCKLGLLKEGEAEVKPSIKEDRRAKTQTSTHLQPPWSSNPDMSGSKQPSHSASESNQELAGQPNNGGNVVCQRSMSDLTAASSEPHHTKLEEAMASTLERSTMGMGDSMSSYKFTDCQKGCSAHEGPASPSKARVPGQVSTTPPVPYKHSHASGLSVLMRPSMADDRREALRKLGLLKS